ncbi:hypothetical protein ACFY5D_21905 [Paeniglutamicibacter sp. NPDC012692]|uniref:hypothetical protein n=1 Tax=Paeniglutamicibacter sp. NPDC012692 TaxID=3364388 RepID=UPI003683792D
MDKDPRTAGVNPRDPDSTLADVVNSERDRPARTGRRLFLAVLTLFIVLALAGAFGRESTKTTGPAGTSVTVTAPSAIRAGMDANVEVAIRSARAITEPVTIAVEHRYLDSFTTFGMSPAAGTESSDGRFLLLEYDPPKTEAFRVVVAGTSAEDSTLRISGTLKVYVGDELLSTIELDTWKVP